MTYSHNGQRIVNRIWPPPSGKTILIRPIVNGDGAGFIWQAERRESDGRRLRTGRARSWGQAFADASAWRDGKGGAS
jgi:hypothetical protein